MGLSARSASVTALAAAPGVCEALKTYPHIGIEKLSFESNDISPLCKPFVKLQRHDLDRCGDTVRDPYTSHFTWSSRNDMAKKGKVNLYDPEMRPELNQLLRHVENLRQSASQLCCGSDLSCHRMMNDVQVTVCRPSSDPNVPDPCVFGGSYKMSGDGYSAIFRSIDRVHDGDSETEFRKLALKNLTTPEQLNPMKPGDSAPNGSITLSSYVNKAQGTSGLDPVILHEFGHACSMIKMKQAALAPLPQHVDQHADHHDQMDASAKALRAVQWLDRARSRCQADLELPEAYYDFWESVGESRSLAACLYKLTSDNQKQQIDRPCPQLCAGHYLEESVGIAFSLLLGDLSGIPSAVFPVTCDHVRDGQHPMVSDVVDCLAQNSPRFRERMKQAYACSGS